MQTHEPAVQLVGVNKSFSGRPAVRGLDLVVERGSLVGLIGPNGAGKTTSIRMIMSILFPDSGSVRVLGKASAVESKDRIGYLPEERGVYKKMKVGVFLRYMARLKDVPEEGLSQKVGAWLERVELSHVINKKCEELSKGMQQKVQFIASILHEPDLIILDEPFSGLDPVNSRLLRALVHEQHQQGRTIIFSTHQMSQAEALCDRVVMIHQGRKVLDDTPADIRARFDPRALLVRAPRGVDLATLPALVPEVERVEVVERGSALTQAFLRPGVDAMRALASVAGAVPVERVEVLRPTLEDVFIEIVQGGAVDPEQRAVLLGGRAADGGDGGGD